jgi:hypothetical protein
LVNGRTQCPFWRARVAPRRATRRRMRQGKRRRRVTGEKSQVGAFPGALARNPTSYRIPGSARCRWARESARGPPSIRLPLADPPLPVGPTPGKAQRLTDWSFLGDLVGPLRAAYVVHPPRARAGPGAPGGSFAPGGGRGHEIPRVRVGAAGRAFRRRRCGSQQIRPAIASAPAPCPSCPGRAGARSPGRRPRRTAF